MDPPVAVARSQVHLNPPVELGGVPPLDIVLEALTGLSLGSGAILVLSVPISATGGVETLSQGPR